MWAWTQSASITYIEEVTMKSITNCVIKIQDESGAFEELKLVYELNCFSWQVSFIIRINSHVVLLLIYRVVFKGKMFVLLILQCSYSQIICMACREVDNLIQYNRAQ